MLSLQIARGHERFRPDAFRRKFHSVFDVVFVDDAERKGVENGLFEVFVDAVRMVLGNEAHLFREWEVEKENTALRTVTRPIINITIGTHVPPRMRAVQLLELLIHSGRYEKWQLRKFWTESGECVNKNLLPKEFRVVRAGGSDRRTSHSRLRRDRFLCGGRSR